ncbi:hypothetical protein DV515_00010800 [Chloebia gouldiae]|uniref:Uncharacterized protein n=1 Tax=Chloebia gouldiae TaxID=44316 RepID=A0A3L8S880_CHLGU|nr:hypothetical protein DV515_00010800 [Chloebia gouldiae]
MSCTLNCSPLHRTGHPAWLVKHPKGDASPDVILPSVGFPALLGMQVSLSHASFSIFVPSSTEMLISMVQSHMATSFCPKGASAARGWSWVTADALAFRLPQLEAAQKTRDLEEGSGHSPHSSSWHSVLPAASVQGRALASVLGSAALPPEPGWGDSGGERAPGAPPRAWVNR